MAVLTISIVIHKAHMTTSPSKIYGLLLEMKWISAYRVKYLKCNTIGDRWIRPLLCRIFRNKSLNKHHTRIDSQITIKYRANKCQDQILLVKTTILQDSVRRIHYFRTLLQYQRKFWMSSQECHIKLIVWPKLTTKDHFSNNQLISQTRASMNRMKVS